MVQVPIRRIERLIRITQWLLIAGAVWLVLDTVFLRKPLPLPDLAGARTADGGVPEGTTSGVTLPQLAAIWGRDLRQTLIEPEPKPKPKPKPQPPPSPTPVSLPKLLATFVEGGKGWGLFLDGRGSQRVRPAGTRIEEFDIVTISPGAATLRKGDRTYDVQVPKSRLDERRRQRRG